MMLNLNAMDIAGAVRGSIIYGPRDRIIDKISLDTRTLEPGSLFIPIKGENFDGHDFIDEAIKKGAKAVLVHRKGKFHYNNVTMISVRDTLEALHLLARWYRTRFNVDFIAVTGSTGKTTTKNIIAALLKRRYRVLRSPGNYNNQIGLPLTVMNLDYAHRLGVVEMGMRGFGEIKELMKIVVPKVSVITNIGMSHIERLGSRGGILKAKMEIFQGMGNEPLAVVNADDELLKSSCRDLDIPLTFYGLKAGDYRAENVASKGEKGMTYTLSVQGRKFDAILPLPGLHSVYNSLAAIAVARHFGMDFDEIIDALKTLEGEDMRLSIQNVPGSIKVINDVYNASPESMKAALRVLKDITGKRKIAVLADMLELGEFAEEGHRFVGKVVADTSVDILITVGDKSRFIALEAEKMGLNPQSIYYFNDKQRAKNLLKGLVEEGDIVLIKGSRGMQMEELVEGTLERG